MNELLDKLDHMFVNQRKKSKFTRISDAVDLKTAEAGDAKLSSVTSNGEVSFVFPNRPSRGLGWFGADSVFDFTVGEGGRTLGTFKICSEGFRSCFCHWCKWCVWYGAVAW